MTLLISTAAAKNPRVVLDTNILVSAQVFKGKPATIVGLAQVDTIKAFSSEPLLTELYDVLARKFLYPKQRLDLLDSDLRGFLQIVQPAETLQVVDDEPDNRVLEAAVAGDCDYIVTGDKLLLKLGSYQRIKIVSADQFLSFISREG